MIFFLALILISFLGAHFLLYFSLARFFVIHSASVRIFIGAILGILAASFIISSFVTHYIDTPASRALYIASGVWVGLLITLLLAVALGWIMILINNIAGGKLPLLYLNIVFMLSAIGYTAWGIHNAFSPEVKHIDVSIRNLPEYWKGKTVVQLSDVHLGHIYRQDFLEKVVKEVNSLNPDAVFITGDLFDGMDGNLENLTGPLAELKPKDGTFFVTGNHETYLGVKKSFDIIGKFSNIRILDDETENINGLQIVGLSYPERGEQKDFGKIFSSMKNFQKGLPTILLYHAPTDTGTFENMGVNLQLSGHTHVGQIFPLKFITEMIYGKYYYGLNRDGDYSIYTTSGVGTWGPPVRTGNASEIVEISLN